MKSGFAIHTYACNKNMVNKAFYNSDGDFLIGGSGAGCVPPRLSLTCSPLQSHRWVISPSSPSLVNCLLVQEKYVSFSGE